MVINVIQQAQAWAPHAAVRWNQCRWLVGKISSLSLLLGLGNAALIWGRNWYCSNPEILALNILTPNPFLNGTLTCEQEANAIFFAPPETTFCAWSKETESVAERIKLGMDQAIAIPQQIFKVYMPFNYWQWTQQAYHLLRGMRLRFFFPAG